MNPLALIPAQYKVYAELAVLALALALAGACGWMVNGWRLETRNAHDREVFAQAQAKALGAAVKQRDDALAQVATQATQMAAIDATNTANLKRLSDENDSLRARADAGSVRVRVNGAHCPATHDVPQTTGSAGVGAGAGPELDADARRNYFDFRGALGHVLEQLAACQQAVAVGR